MKPTAFSSQSVTTFADAVVIGVMRHAASNNHARLRVMAVLRDVRHVWPELRAGRPIAARRPQVMKSRRLMRNMGFPPLSRRLARHTLTLPQASKQVLGPDLNRSESRRGAL